MSTSVRLRSLARSAAGPTVRTGILYVFTGGAFAVANLLLARALPAETYATVALAIALVNLGSGIAPVGLNGVVIRRGIAVDARLLLNGIAAAALTGAVVGTTAEFVYGIHSSVAFVVCLAVVFGGITVLAEARFRVLQRFSAILLVQSGSFAVLAAAAFLTISGQTEAWLAPAIMAGLYCVTSGWSWARLLSEPSSAQTDAVFDRSHWKDAAYYAGLAAVAGLFLQLERLLVPILLSLAELATVGVVAALVMSPYRILQLSTSYTLLPRLSALKSAHDRQQVLRNEVLTVGALAALAAVPIWLLTPMIVDLLVGDKIPVSGSVLGAAMFGAMVKLVEAITRTTATAFCTTEELAQLGFFAWFALVVAGAAAWVGSRWGLPGVIYGIAIGSVVRTIAAAQLATPYIIQGTTNTLVADTRDD